MVYFWSNQLKHLYHKKENDKFFKMDVLYYLDKSNNVEVFYDAITKKLLGYKERNRDLEISCGT